MTYENLNMSELVAQAKQNGYYAAHRGLEREHLISMIERKADKDYPPDPVDVAREGMLQMQSSWPTIRSQLKCADENYACWICPSARAYICAIEECEPNIIEHVRHEKHSG